MEEIYVLKTVENILIMLNNLLQIHLRLLQKELFKKQQKQLEIFKGNKIADKIANVSRMIPRNSQKVVESETENTGFNKEIPKAKYISRKTTLFIC